MLMTTYQGTETYLIECSRENSVINRIDDENTNGAWSNETEFNLKTGDRISVEMVSANIQGSGTGAPTIEFSGQNVVVNGEEKKYCDTKVLLEVFFYMNNNNTYSVGLPLIHPSGGINGTADLSSNRNIHMPVNLCPRLPVNQVTNQPNNFRELNEKVGYISQYAKVNEIELSHGIVGDAYGIHQYKYAPPNDPSANWYPDCSANVIVEGIRVLHEVGVGPATLATTFSSALEGQAGDLSQNNFHVGNHVYVDNNETITDASYRCWWLGQIKSLESYLVNGIKGLQIMFEPTTIVNTFDASENAQVASYVGTVYEWTPSTTPPWPYPTYLPNFNLKAGSSQEGLINYDNLNWDKTNTSDDHKLGNNGLFIYSKNIKKPQTNQSVEFNVFPHTEFEPAVDVCGNSFTSSAGEFGDKETGAQFGYRNANIQQENNNQPYIFMRNDHFGVGRMGKNGETYPLAEPMSAFIYISIEELLQDVNSLSAVINEKLNETLMGIGTTTQQTNQLLLNSLEIPEDMKQASNITPFYNRVGFYDRNVTDNSQNILMKQVANTQFRNIVTDIVPIKNGGAVKINPANLTPGLNYLALSFGKQYGGVPSMTPEGVNPTLDEQLWRAQHTYLRELLVSSQITGTDTSTVTALVSYNYNDWANPIYGNMATADLFKYQVGDRFARLPLDKCNFLDYSSNKLEVRNVGKSIVLNNLLSYRKLEFKYPNLLNEYDNPNSPTSTPTSLVVNDLYENQLIYTNILFPTSVSQSWIDFAESLRKYETYYNLSKNAPNDFKTQQNDYKSWIWDADVGQTDDRSTGQLRQTPGQPENLPPFTTSGTNPLSFHQQNRPMIWDWLAKPPITATDVSSAMFNTALGVTTNDYSSIFDMDASRNLICPSTSHEIFAGISMTGNSDEQEKMRFMKDLGRLKLKSRFDKHWYANSRNYLNFNINSFSPVANPEVYDTGVKEAYQNNVDTSFAAKYDLPVVPYYYTKPDGDKVLLCAFQVGTKYVADSTKLSTINFGSMCWGNTIGVSSSFFDNHAIVPMNNDQVKRSTLLTQSTVGKPGYITICRQFSDNLDTRFYINPPQAPQDFVPNQISWNSDNSGNSQGYKVPPYQDVQNNNRMKFKCTWSGGPLGVPNVTAEWYQSNNLYEPVADYLPINVDALLPTFGGLQLGTSPVSFSSPNGLGQAGLGYGSISDMKVYLDSGGMPVEYVNVTIEIYRNATITQNKNQVPLNLGIQHNNVNYVWVGSTKPTFQYNATKGRVEFVQLQEDNILNQLTSSSGGAISTNSTGQPAAIINSAIQDAVYSRNTTNEDYSNPAQTTPVKNQGIRAEISGIGIYNVYLCPENYNPPNDVNLSSYWSNKVVGNSKYQQTVLNRQKIIEGCIPASEKNWTGSLFSRLGFQSYRELLPVYGKQSNRFNPSTYNTTKPNLINRATKPLILCNTVDNRINPALNTYYTAQIPAPHNIVNGLPLYSNGLLNNESTILDLEPQSLTATSPPILSTSPFLLIESDICQTNWRSGRTQQNVLFYLMKNYQASSFIYGYGSSYSHTVNQDRVLSLIHTAFRDPTTGRLQKCSSNSTIIYKIQRNVVILPPSTNVLNVPLNSSVPVSTTNKLLGEILEVEKGNKIHRKHYNTKNESQTNDTKQPGTKETNPETKQPETKETNETKETK